MADRLPGTQSNRLTNPTLSHIFGAFHSRLLLALLPARISDIRTSPWDVRQLAQIPPTKRQIRDDVTDPASYNHLGSAFQSLQQLETGEYDSPLDPVAQTSSSSATSRDIPKESGPGDL